MTMSWHNMLRLVHGHTLQDDRFMAKHHVSCFMLQYPIIVSWRFTAPLPRCVVTYPHDFPSGNTQHERPTVFNHPKTVISPRRISHVTTAGWTRHGNYRWLAGANRGQEMSKHAMPAVLNIYLSPEARLPHLPIFCRSTVSFLEEYGQPLEHVVSDYWWPMLQ